MFSQDVDESPKPLRVICGIGAVLMLLGSLGLAGVLFLMFAMMMSHTTRPSHWFEFLMLVAVECVLVLATWHLGRYALRRSSDQDS